MKNERAEVDHEPGWNKLGAWSGLIYMLVFGSGWWFLSWFMPPIAPNASRADIATRYHDHHTLLMLGAILMMVSTFFLFPLGALVVQIIRKIERGLGPLSITMIFTLSTLAVLNYYTGMMFSMAAFRTDRPVALVQAFTDMGFMQFIGGTPLFLGIWIVIAYAVLVTQRRTTTIVPRWVGYVSLFVVVLYLPEVLIYIFHTGPFAWTGVIGFWIPAVLLIGYMALTPVVLVPIVRKHFAR